MEKCNTEEMRRIRKCYWSGDFIDYISHNASRASKLWCMALQPLLYFFCRAYVPTVSSVIAFRRSSRKEIGLSRFRQSTFSYHQKLRILPKTAHFTVLIRDNEGIISECMFSACVRFPTYMECIDVNKVKRIRLLLWIGMQLCCTHSMNSNFMQVWIDVVMPYCLSDKGFARNVVIRDQAWETDSIL